MAGLTSMNFNTNSSDWNSIFKPVITPGNLVFNGTLGTNQTLVANAPNTTLELQNGANIQNGFLIGFNHLLIDNPTTTPVFVDMTVAQWNAFFPNFDTSSDNPSHKITIDFSGAGGTFST